MAKSDSFFIRAKVRTNAGSYAQNPIDLGSFVNLGISKSTLLRIHNVSVQYSDDTGPAYPIYSVVVPGAKAAWQLTTQSQTQLITADDKSMISSGSLTALGDSTSTAHGQALTQVDDMNPQNWTQGYLIGVDTLYLAVDDVGTFANGEIDVCIVMECTLENATQASSVALSLSQN
jgi:hypothetical protein